jgi:hypothetical protein
VADDQDLVAVVLPPSGDDPLGEGLAARLDLGVDAVLGLADEGHAAGEPCHQDHPVERPPRRHEAQEEQRDGQERRPPGPSGGGGGSRRQDIGQHAEAGVDRQEQGGDDHREGRGQDQQRGFAEAK